jgi:hypothetical protein
MAGRRKKSRDQSADSIIAMNLGRGKLPYLTCHEISPLLGIRNTDNCP